MRRRARDVVACGVTVAGSGGGACEVVSVGVAPCVQVIVASCQRAAPQVAGGPLVARFLLPASAPMLPTPRVDMQIDREIIHLRRFGKL